jgi:predicted transcriptional regulator
MRRIGKFLPVFVDEFNRVLETEMMETNGFFAHAHHLIEQNEERRISQSEMAQRLGISVRAYSNYLGGHETTALNCVTKILRMLPKTQAYSLIKKIYGEEILKKEINEN